jgi:hypothetical protein
MDMMHAAVYYIFRHSVHQYPVMSGGSTSFALPGTGWGTSKQMGKQANNTATDAALIMHAAAVHACTPHAPDPGAIQFPELGMDLRCGMIQGSFAINILACFVA